MNCIFLLNMFLGYPTQGSRSSRPSVHIIYDSGPTSKLSFSEYYMVFGSFNESHQKIASGDRLYFLEELRSNSVYSGTFLLYPAELRFPMPPKNGKGKKVMPKERCIYQHYS